MNLFLKFILKEQRPIRILLHNWTDVISGILRSKNYFLY